MQKISKWQILRWDLQRKWEHSFLRRYPIILWAYTKVFLASQFATREFVSFLKLDGTALSVMSKNRRDKYILYLTKARSIVGNHTFDPNITIEDLDKQSQSLLYDFKNRK
ncbi:MAG: hypothetical protein WCL02_01575 [bacterium]